MNERTALVQEVCRLVDGAARSRALVFGSLPPGGRDLDLFVRSAEAPLVRTALREAGMAEDGHRFAAFRCGAAYAVEVDPAESLELPTHELEALYAEATLLAGYRQLAQPAPHHRLLILAHVVQPGSSRITPRRYERITEALREDPAAWGRAAERADAWGATAELTRLKAMYENARVGPGRIRRPRRGAVIALSGIDGSGKSFQAQSLQAVLTDLGHEVAVEWWPLGQNPSLDRLAWPVKRVLRRRRASPNSNGHGPAPDPGTALRTRTPAVNYIWSAVVAAVNGLSHARRCLPHLLAGRVVVFDRYVLDSSVRLRVTYGADRPFRLQRTLIRALSPRARCAFFLDVAAETSIARKEDRWHVDELRQQVGYYRAEYARHGVERLDGERDPEALCAEIAAAVWRKLG